MSTKTDARRMLHDFGSTGNWRFKGLLAAALPSTGVDMKTMAKAWPSSGQPSTYRFLSGNSRYDPKEEANRRIVQEQGDAHYRILREFAGEDGLDKTLAASKPKELEGGALGSGVDDMISRALFAAATPEEVNTLFREELIDVVQAGAERRKVARDAANVMNVDTRTGDIPVAQDEIFAPETAEGAEIRDNREEYDTVRYDTTKFGVGARVTDEMQRSGMIDVIERQIEFVGEAVENAINRQWLTTLVDNASNNFDTGGSDQGVPAINGAYGEVDQDDFMPDTFVTHPEYRTTLFDDENIAFANRAGTDDVVRERVFNPLLGVEHFGASDATYDPDGSETWGFGSDGDKGAVVYDSSNIHLLIEQDIEVKDYDDPIRDLNGVNARAITDTKYTQQRAAATVEY